MSADARIAAALAALDAAREVLSAVAEGSVDAEASTTSGPPLLLRFDNAAEMSGTSRTGIFGLVKSGELPAVDVPGVGRRIRLSDLQAWVDGLGPAS